MPDRTYECDQEESLQNIGWDTFDYPLCSPDFPANDFYLFFHLKLFFVVSGSAVIKIWKNVLHNTYLVEYTGSNDLGRKYKKLTPRYEIFQKNHGSYVEKYFKNCRFLCNKLLYLFFWLFFYLIAHAILFIALFSLLIISSLLICFINANYAI